MGVVVFFDPSCQCPYDSHTLQVQATGGTEASVTRIADALGALVMQHNRTEASGRYLPPEPMSGVHAVVLNRESRALPTVRRLYPGARVYLWVHDRLNPGSKRGRRLASTAHWLLEMQVTIVCVSDTQRRGVDALLRSIGIDGAVRTVTIYNPVDDDMAPDGSPIDERKLVFFSTPNKGLNFALDAFRVMRDRMPDLRLLVGNPGYRIAPLREIEGVSYLGAQPQHRIHAEVRTALCTFFPNFVLPETFGLVFAESKALGTPVLTHDCGAAAEIIGDPQQLLSVRQAHRVYEYLLRKAPLSWRRGPALLAGRLRLFDSYTERVAAWRSGSRPRTGPDRRFHLSVVARQWRSMLDSQPTGLAAAKSEGSASGRSAGYRRE